MVVHHSQQVTIHAVESEDGFTNRTLPIPDNVVTSLNHVCKSWLIFGLYSRCLTPLLHDLVAEWLFATPPTVNLDSPPLLLESKRKVYDQFGREGLSNGGGGGPGGGACPDINDLLAGFHAGRSRAHHHHQHHVRGIQ